MKLIHTENLTLTYEKNDYGNLILNRFRIPVSNVMKLFDCNFTKIVITSYLDSVETDKINYLDNWTLDRICDSLKNSGYFYINMNNVKVGEVRNIRVEYYV